MNKNISKVEIMEKGEITKTLLILGIPMIISMLVTALYNIVDTYFVSSLGTQQSAAVAIAFPISLYFSGIGLTFGVGAASYISRLLGAKKNEEANIVATVSFYTSIIFAIILAIFLIVFIRPILIFMGATETVIPFALEYTVIFIVSTFLSTINITMGNISIAQGQTTVTLKSMLCGAILNIILDPLFIKYLAMGVKGAAIATLISQIVTLIIYFYFFFIGNSYIKIKLNNFKPTLSIYIEVVKVGMFMFILQVLTGFSITLISNKAKIYGVATVSAMGIVLRIVALGVNVIFGFMKGYQPFAGYNYGAKNINRVKEITKKSIEITTLYSLIWSIVIFIFSKEIMSIMIKDPEVIKIGEKALRYNTILFFTFGFQFTFATLYLSIGKAFIGGILNIGRQGLFFIPSIIILNNILGLKGIMLAQPVADIISIFVTICVVIYFKRLQKRKLPTI